MPRHCSRPGCTALAIPSKGICSYHHNAARLERKRLKRERAYKRMVCKITKPRRNRNRAALIDRLLTIGSDQSEETVSDSGAKIAPTVVLRRPARPTG